MWGSNALRSFSPWAAETVRLGWRSFDIASTPLASATNRWANAATDIPPNASAGGQEAFNGHDITTDHISRVDLPNEARRGGRN